MSDNKKKQTKPLDLINPINLKHNMGVLGYFRTFISVITGIVIGLLGVQGWWGFVPHFGSQFLCILAMFAKGGSPPKNYFGTWSNLLFYNVFSSLTLLSYMLCWMTFFNIGHVFA